MENLTVSASPHITNRNNTTRGIMIDVLIALMPALIAAIFYFGYHVVINVVVCMGTCFLAEMLFTMIIHKKFNKETAKKSTAWDFSSLVTGLILALNLPSIITVKSWGLNVKNAGGSVIFSFDTIIICIIGSLFAIMLVKMLFGGIGKNFCNPACAARIFLMLSFGLMAVQTIGAGFDASTGATWLSGNKNTNNQSMFLQMFLGNKGSSAVGETCAIAIILGYLYLSIRKVIDFRIPLIIVGSAAAFSLIFDGLGRGLTGTRLINNMFANILSGGLIFGAVFMATDYSTSPNTFWGQVIFCVGIAFFTILIRRYTKMPEGMSFAILLMNIVTPLIDKYIVPKPFGYIKPIKKKKVEEPRKMTMQNNNGEKKAEVKA